MADIRAARNLFQIKDQIKNCLSTYSRELERRSNRTAQKLLALAPNDDVLYCYLFPRDGSEYVAPAIEALRQNRGVKMLFLPGVLENVENTYQFYKHDAEKAFHVNVRPTDVLGLDETHKGVLDHLKLELASYCDRLSDFRLATQRYAALKSAAIAVLMT